MSLEFDPEIEMAAQVDEAFAEAIRFRRIGRVEIAAMALAEPIAKIENLTFEQLKRLESGDIPPGHFQFRLFGRGLLSLDIATQQKGAPHTPDDTSESGGLLTEFERAHLELDTVRQAQIAMYGLTKREVRRAEALAHTLWLELVHEDLPEEEV